MTYSFHYFKSFNSNFLPQNPIQPTFLHHNHDPRAHLFIRNIQMNRLFLWHQMAQQFQVQNHNFLLPQNLFVPNFDKKLEDNDDCPSDSVHIVSDFKIEDFSEKIEETDGLSSIRDDDEQSQQHDQKALRGQVAEILHYFLEYHGKMRVDEFFAEKKKLAGREDLELLFDALESKFRLAWKCREDMIRSVLRKAIITLRNDIRQKYHITAKMATGRLCKKYFPSKYKEMVENGVDIEKEVEVINYLLPYKKNSRNKTANSSFIAEIFSSKEFSKDYGVFLGRLDGILKDDNEAKEAKFIDFLVCCVENNTFAPIRNFRRIPWLEAWLDSTKNIAKELCNPEKMTFAPRRPKKKMKLNPKEEVPM